MKKIKCQCGNKFKLDQHLVTCRICSTAYRDSGEMIISRHNWNIKDYFCAFEKNQSSQP